MKLVSESGCATETVEKYIAINLYENKIYEKKGKFRILYSPELEPLELEFYQLMLNPTIKTTLLVLLKSKPLSQIELVAITDKSNPSISLALKTLFDRKIVRRNYHAPYSTYEIINKSKLYSLLETTVPNIANNFESFDTCYPIPSVFLSIYD
jgi:predicted transcriptional regulator